MSCPDIPTHTPDGEPIPSSVQLEQLDQAITMTLQEIDANFAKAHQTITASILPAVKRYGISSFKTWEGAKFWKSFFETAANVSLSPQYPEGDGMTDEPSSQTFTSDGQDTSRSAYQAGNETSSPLIARQRNERKLGGGEDISVDDIHDGSIDDSIDQEAFLASLNKKSRGLTSPPRLSDASVAATTRVSKGDAKSASQWAPVESPFDKLRKDLANDFEKGEDDNLQRLTKDVEGVDINNKSSTHSRVHGSSTPGGTSKGAGRASGSKNYHPRVQATPRGASKKGNPFATAETNVAPNASTSSPSKWNGIADLRKTPLTQVKGKKVKSKAKSDAEARENDWKDSDGESELDMPKGMSPPVTMQFSVPRSRYAKTPAKQAAKLMVDDLLRSVHASSPSVREREMKLRDSTRKSGHSLGKSSAKQSLIHTPLKKASSSRSNAQKRRSSLPTPPTITKKMEPPTLSTTPAIVPGSRPSSAVPDSPSNSISRSARGGSAGKLLDKDEDGAGHDEEEEVPEDLGTGLSKVAMAKTSAGVDELLEMNDDESDDDSDEDETDEEDDDEISEGQMEVGEAIAKSRTVNVTSLTSSSAGTRSIDEDTLFGIQEPRQPPVPHPSNPKQPRSGVSSSYKPRGAVDDMGTIYNGRPLLSEGRDDTYSAPSPTPYGRT